MRKPSFKDVLPEYPSIQHLPWKPNSKGDKIATEEDVSIFFKEEFKVYIEEKIDGANCGMTYLNDHPVIRNRTKILRKGQELKNPSLAQFASAFNWMHENKPKFLALADYGPYSVYGEWMIQQHGMAYDSLLDWFVAFDLYDWEKGKYIDPWKAYNMLVDCGFYTIVPFQSPVILSFEDFEKFANFPSLFAKDSLREGIVVKVSDGDHILRSFKMVRQGFNQGCLLGDEIKRNKLR